MRENNTTQRAILLIDGYHLLHKGFYGSLKRNKNSLNKDGIMVNAVYTFIAKIFESVKLDKYHTIIVTFDVGNSCWRRDLYPAYKGKRKETPPELKPQMQIVRDFLTNANIPWYEKETFEGDDVMGTISRIATKLGYKVEILSNDKDIYQLVDENCHVISKASRTAPELHIHEEDVLREFKIKPCQIPDIKALMGDSSDNLKGVMGLHYNQAQALINQYGTVENMFENIDKVSEGALNRKLSTNKEKILLNKKLATIQKNIDLGWINFRPLKVNFLGWNYFLRENGMFSFMRIIKPQLEAQRKQRRDDREARENNQAKSSSPKQVTPKTNEPKVAPSKVVTNKPDKKYNHNKRPQNNRDGSFAKQQGIGAAKSPSIK